MNWFQSAPARERTTIVSTFLHPVGNVSTRARARDVCKISRMPFARSFQSAPVWQRAICETQIVRLLGVVSIRARARAGDGGAANATTHDPWFQSTSARQVGDESSRRSHPRPLVSILTRARRATCIKPGSDPPDRRFNPRPRASGRPAFHHHFGLVDLVPIRARGERATRGHRAREERPHVSIRAPARETTPPLAFSEGNNSGFDPRPRDGRQPIPRPFSTATGFNPRLAYGEGDLRC
jgi:hypothetical protein